MIKATGGMIRAIARSVPELIVLTAWCYSVQSKVSMP